LARCAIAEALVSARLVVESEPGANAGLGLGDRRIGVEVDLLIFQVNVHALGGVSGSARSVSCGVVEVAIGLGG
jgi:hypothetical protein